MPYRRTRSAPLLTVVVLILGACTDATVATTEPTPAEELVGSAWIVTSINGQGVVPAAPPTMAFGADGKISGTGGCNQYSAPYETTGGTIAIGDISSTLMLCEGAAGTQESVFLAALRGATAWRLDDDGALHLDGVGEIIADPATQAPTPEASPAGSAEGLVGAWDLAELGPTADLAHLQPTIEFSADGAVSGFRGMQHVQRRLRDRWRHDLVRADGDDEDGLPATRQRGRGRLSRGSQRGHRMGGRA